ncbi:hypothetical protein FO440_18480 [Mucilaginibacter corticis]|uniref:Uncharacterized protein n=1 Tax=Mucilaginibacter corticis TaxID=2597670 RepID=A0A556MIS7_9SPHI|nr:hypothetical protein [Mucilaginibacter corticis]TSJ39725.1 hypothetical protein FO440_18480 [Mucilaginibacter corticis]
MNKMKTLADQLRDRMAKPDTPLPGEKPTAPVIESLRAYDMNGHKSVVHSRFDEATARTLHHFKMATGVEVNRLICYSVKVLLEQHPEIKTIVKQYLQKLEL